MLSLPIPTQLDSTSYDDLTAPGGRSYGDIIRELAIGRAIGKKGAHLDPDLIYTVRPRRAGWRASLGQINAAAGHLRNQDIEPGDLFLFYGFFRQTDEIDGHLRFQPSARGFHAIYGYLEVDQILYTPQPEDLPQWIFDHPHALPQRLSQRTNTIYVATSSLTSHPTFPGADVFRFDERLVLTQRGMLKSRWKLDPAIFRHLTISYHQTAAWREGYFQSYPRAQEYVIHADTGAAEWALSLVTQTRRRSQ
jgi:hypothetical protein